MLSAKPWKAEAVARLILSIFICVFAGSFVAAGIQNILARNHRSTPAILMIALAVVCLAAAVRLLQTTWESQNVPRRLIAFLLCFYVGLSLGLWGYKLAGPVGPSTLQMVVATLSFQGMTLVLARQFIREHGTSWVDAFGLKNHWLTALLLGVIVACIFLPIGINLQWLAAKFILPHLRIAPEEQQAVKTLQMATGLLDRLGLGIVTILLVPPAEELLFRGVLYPWGKRVGFPRLALWGTSILFGAVHMNLLSFVPLTLLAVCLALLYEWTDNLLAPITAHSLFNAFNFATLYLSEHYWHR
jgi:membrane protease YdiL (CAAX protease family)